MDRSWPRSNLAKVNLIILNILNFRLQLKLVFWVKAHYALNRACILHPIAEILIRRVMIKMRTLTLGIFSILVK